MTIREQAALMRLGLRFIRDNGCANNWQGKLPSADDIDRWQAAQLSRLRRELAQAKRPMRARMRAK